MNRICLGLAFVPLLCVVPARAATADPHDWPTYNRDFHGTRHNSAETKLSPRNVEKLAELWQFPTPESGEEIGVIHGTPIVVAGCVYFGTATDAAFYKLKPDGTLAWTYRNPAFGAAPATAAIGTNKEARKARFQPSDKGIVSSALVADDTVYFADTAGWFYALNTADGAERWKVNARDSKFPGAHPLNLSLGSPMFADGKVIFVGGAIEQLIAGSSFYRGSTGRGFVVALEPETGSVVWKYDVGPKPEVLDPPITLEDSWGKYTFYSGPATSSVWSTPSYDADTQTLYFGTDVNTAPRRPTPENPDLHTPDSCAIVAIDVRDGSRRWSTQINSGDVWTNSMRAYDPKTGYKDQSIGDTPKIITIDVDGAATKVVGAGCKNGGFYLLDAGTGKIVAQTPIYTGPPTYPLMPPADPRMLALPSIIGGLQSGCATDGRSVFTNGIDALQLGTAALAADAGVPPSGGRVVSISADIKTENWRHERPKLAKLGGPAPAPELKDVGDPVASGIAVANGVVYFTTAASGKLIALDAAKGNVLREIELGPVFCGPSVSRGHVYVGTGNTLLSPEEPFFPKKPTGTLFCFGLAND